MKLCFKLILLSFLFPFLLFSTSVVFSSDQSELVAGEILVKVGDNVQQKYDDASKDETLVFDVGTYTLNLTIDRPINFRGVSTASVILKGDGVNPIFFVTENVSTVIQNFTLAEANIGLSVESGTMLVKNNVFMVGTAVQMNRNVEMSIENNTFYNINTAVEVFEYESSVTMTNNIFSNMTVPQSLLINVLNDRISDNCFDEAVNISSLGLSQTAVDNDLGFVDEANKDFHLTVDSICKDASDSALDMGAFGGEEADEYAFPVAGVSVVAGSTDSSVTVSWEKNNDYRVEGYDIYYDREGMQGFDFFTDRETLSIKTVAADTTSVSIDNLQVTLATPNAPALISVLPVSSGKLAVKWSVVSNATVYTVYYRGANNVVLKMAADNVDSHTLVGLADGEKYTVWVEAVNQYRYFFQVTPYINNVDAKVEGLFINADKEYLRANADVVSAPSLTLDAIPESVEPYPALPNEGCFIATAAFGYYSHSQVQILRDFRDNYLLKNKYGTQFVAWYYRYGPHAAAFINEHHFFKPVVRVALYPLIVAAEAMAYHVISFWLLMGFYLFALVVIIKLLQRKIEINKIRRSSCGLKAGGHVC